MVCVALAGKRSVYTLVRRRRRDKVAMGRILSRMQWRIAIPYTLLIGACLFGLSAYLAAFLSRVQVDALRTRLASEAGLIGEVVLPTLLVAGGDGLSANEATQLRNQVDRLALRTDARITIVDRNGVVLADSAADPARMENHASRPEIAAALAGGNDASSVTRRSATLGENELYVATPIRAGDTFLGVARLAVPLQAVNAAIRQVMLVVAGALVAAIVIAVGLALWIAGFVTGPLRRLTTVADEVARGSPLAVLGMPHEGEIGRLAEAFNQMADQLKAQMLSLAHERDVLASVLTNMADGIVVVSQDGTVMIANEAARRLLDMVEAPEGLSLARAVRDHEICEALDEALAHGTRRTEVRRAGRSARHLRVAAAPLREGGGLLVLRDVTEERRVENLRRDFVANVSHELRTPIAALKALVETLEEGALDDPPAARDFLRRIHVEVDGLAQLVAELLELSRVESGRAQLTLEAVEPDELVRSAAERLQAQAERLGLTLTWDAGDELSPVLADRTRVEHVLLALVHNAIKFTPPGGMVRVAVQPEGAFAHFSVADTGTGIPEEDVPRIFERFYKVDRARAAVGTGLGLAIAKHVVQALGGQIWAESEVDRGTTVHFTLPTATGEPEGQRSSLAARY
jgi:two-component system phosphate regulon sensor histidine kinase PhoR